MALQVFHMVELTYDVVLYEWHASYELNSYTSGTARCGTGSITVGPRDRTCCPTHRRRTDATSRNLPGEHWCPCVTNLMTRCSLLRGRTWATFRQELRSPSHGRQSLLLRSHRRWPRCVVGVVFAADPTEEDVEGLRVAMGRGASYSLGRGLGVEATLRRG